VDLRPSDVAAIIEIAFRKGFANPRILPTEDPAS
jgi:hypothetical protein